MSFLKHILAVFIVLVSLRSAGQDTTLTVISNSTGSPSAMKFSELQSIFKGERQKWSDGKKVIIVLLKAVSPGGEKTARTIYNFSGAELRAFWAAISFAGKFDPPYVFNSAKEAEKFVAENPGAIGIIDRPADDKRLRTILIDGKKEIEVMHWASTDKLRIIKR